MNTIRTKLWTFIMMIVAAVLVMVWLFQIVFLEDYYVRQRASALQSAAKQITQLFTEEGYPENYPNQAYLSLRVVAATNNCIPVIVDPNGNTMAFLLENSNLSQVDVRDYLMPIWPQIIAGQSIVYTSQRMSRWSPVNSIAVEVGEPFIGADENNYYLCFIAFMEPIRNTVWLLRKQLTLITLISIGIATLLVFWLSRYITYPVLEITRAANRITGGDYDTRVRHKADDEIGVLADTMNNMARKLGENERMQREFVANTSHELKTPISAIRANAELVMDIESQNEAERKQFLQVIVDESIRLNSMLEDILDLSAMESGRQPRREAFDVCEMLYDVRDRMRALVEEREVSLDLDAAGECMVSADPQMMFRVFYNLADNAMKYTPAGGQVTLRAQQSVSGTRVEIEDNGPGIAPEDLRHIWERFYKVDKARSRNGGSSGLGLAIVKSILDAHGFAFGIDSEPGKGTLVWIQMPEQVNAKKKLKKDSKKE